MKDLFGNEISLDEAGRIMKRKSPQPAGYAAPPGTGPKGETCRTCKHYTLREFAGTYRKCWLTRDKWTGGDKTDILARAPACRLWEQREGKPQKRGGYYG